MHQEAASTERMTREDLLREIEDLRAHLQDEQEYSRAIRNGEVDALVISGSSGEQIFTLKEADRPYRIIIEQMKEGTVTISDDGIILYCNMQFAEMLKYPLSRLTGTSFYDHVDPSSRGPIEAILSMGEHETRRAEVTFHTSDHERVYTYVSFAPLEIDQTRTFSGVITDITAERSAQDALKKTNALLERIFGNTHIMVAYMDPHLNFIRVNHAFASACGHDPSFFKGKNLADLCPRMEERTAFLRAVEKGEPYNAEEKPFECFSKASEVMYTDWTLQPVKGEDDKVQGLILTLVDRTERKRLEKERLRFEKAVDQAGDGIVMTDHAGVIRYVNSASEKISGYPRDELLGKTLTLFDSQSPDSLISVVEHEGIWKGRITATKKDSSTSDVDTTVSAVHDDNGSVMNYIVIEHDVTHEVRLEQQVRQVQKMEALGRLAGGIAHDLNNILYPIIINTEIVLEDVGTESSLVKPLEQVLTAAYRQRDLVKQILAFSRRNDQKYKPVSVAPLVREALRFIRASLPSSIEIRQDIRAHSDMILGDQTQIHQVIMNLCSNAADAIRTRTGTIEVTLDNIFFENPPAHLKMNPGRYLRLVIRDTGEGISHEVRDHIFEPFFTTKEVGRGSGMGLSVVHGILESHGGVITVESEAGKGSEFTIFLPLLADVPRQDSPEPASNGPAECRKKILLVDDEESVLSSVKRALGRLGYEVSTARDAGEAIDLFRISPKEYDLMITDQTMPDMTGEQLAEEVAHACPGMPVILCTGFSDVITEKEAEEKGICEVLMKPASTQDLKAAVRKALKA